MKLSRFLSSSPKNTDTNVSNDEKSSPKFGESMKNMRNVARKINSDVSAPMDTVIMAGGLDLSVKAVQKKTNDLHDQISSASASIEQIAANVNQFSGLIERQDVVRRHVGSAVHEMTT